MKKENSKIKNKWFFAASICYYISSIASFFSKNISMGVTNLCLGSCFLCLSMTEPDKNKKDKK